MPAVVQHAHVLYNIVLYFDLHCLSGPQSACAPQLGDDVPPEREHSPPVQTMATCAHGKEQGWIGPGKNASTRC